MRVRRLVTAGIAAAAVVTMTGVVDVSAVPLSNSHGQSCGDSIGTWHFVNNQLPSGTPLGTLVAQFSGGQVGTDTGEYKGNGTSVQHFYVTASGTLQGASTDLPGKLVLSDFTCDGGKKGGGKK